jgi:hypothetical protein
MTTLLRLPHAGWMPRLGTSPHAPGSVNASFLCRRYKLVPAPSFPGIGRRLNGARIAPAADSLTSLAAMRIFPQETPKEFHRTFPLSMHSLDRE